MLLASIEIVAPAISRLPGVALYFPLSVLLPQLVLLAALIVYDMASIRRVHPATIWGELFYILGNAATVAMAVGPPGQAFMKAIT